MPVKPLHIGSDPFMRGADIGLPSKGQKPEQPSSTAMGSMSSGCKGCANNNETSRKDKCCFPPYSVADKAHNNLTDDSPCSFELTSKS